VQINAPYPATAFLAGILEREGHEVLQVDASLMLALRLFSSPGIASIRKALSTGIRSSSVRHFLKHSRDYAGTIEPVIRFLQGHTPSLSKRIISRKYLPEGPRFAPLDQSLSDDSQSINHLSRHDLAIHLASLYLDDLTDVIHDGVDPRFELARYGEKLAASAPTFDAIARALRRKQTLVDQLIEMIAFGLIRDHKPELVGFTLPFPGNVYGALRMARAMKLVEPSLPVVMGGGYVNTELRNLSDPRIFNYADYLTLDEGKLPLLRIIDHLSDLIPAGKLVRTFIRKSGRVRYIDNSPCPPPRPFFIAPSFTGLPLNHYFSMIESPNPMHRIWSCGQWNKLMLAHGCYWHRCAFCDTRLDYIQRYAATPVAAIIDQIEKAIRETAKTGFHFIDEALPPALCRALSTELIARKIRISWWGNVRFDRAFTPDLASLMAKAGCIAVTGGLEAATNRLLSFLDKGFTLEQAARVTRAFSNAGILVHAYLMYGCPSQTEQDTVDSLEFVRQLFEAGNIHSAYWHRFALTIHSPIFQDPARYGIRLVKQSKPTFACNEVPYVDSITCDHNAMGRGLRKSLYNYMQHAGLDMELQAWFDTPIPSPTLSTDHVSVAGMLHEAPKMNNVRRNS
ncbi:MAG: radical SAM protein, partial [bacterium]